ncbi:MAG TPA: alpha-galactosidase, partial [Candidatus Glassbacteria bacterium]|nr:alpha-galactosidase [Candidatus Glassbacteria bacterium]
MNRPLPAELTQSRNRGGLLVENDRISVLIRDGYHLEPALKKGGTTVTPVVSDRGGRPSFYLTVGELAITDFRIDWERVRTETVNDALGSGKRITLPAQAEQYLLMLYEPIRVGAEVELSFYDSYPSVIVARAKFTNLGKARLQIDEVACLAFRLDRRRLDAEARPWEFASYQGAATRWGRDYALVWITPDFDRRNFMGMGELSSREVAGGGTPLVDLWAPQCGLAVVSAETCQQWISLPVKTAADGTVEVRLAQSPDARLGQSVYLDPGASVSTILSAAILHELDYFDPIHIYADLLRAQGVEIPLASPRPVYEPYWKSWGLRKEFTLQQIYASLEELKRVGLRWANLDDGWFTWYGDWDPNPAPGKFPAGEPDMKKFVAELHGRGFLSSLWWYPQGVSPESHLAAEHPDWLVQNEDGSLPLSRRCLYYLCPVHPPCIEFIRGQVRRILADWDYDGLY